MVNTIFWILATAMTLLALGFALRPLLRRDGGDATLHAKRDALERARRAGVLDEAEAAAKLAALGAAAPAAVPAPRGFVVLLALLLPLAAFGIYRFVGEPRALDAEWQAALAVAATTPAAASATADAPAPDMQQAVAGLAERLRAEPDNLEGWLLLGRAYKSMERFDVAREALANAYRLAPKEPDVMVEYAEALVLASDTRRFDGEARTLLEQALAQQPAHQRGLWLLGIADFQAGAFAPAAATWERLLASLPDEAEPRAALLERIADARQRAGLEPLPASIADAAPATSAPPAATAVETPVPADASGAPRLTVTVELAPELQGKVGPSDVLFVYARAAEGPRMPLAIQRLPASSLPVTVTLDDSTSMMPSLKLSTMPRVVVGARISKSGQAAAQPGDFETLSAPIANTRAEPLQLTIDTVVE